MTEPEEKYEVVDKYEGKDTVIYYDTEEEQHVEVKENK